LDERHSAAAGRQRVGVEGDAEERAAEGVHQVTGRHVARVAPTLDDDCPLAGSDRLDDDRGRVPASRDDACGGGRKEHGVAIGQPLRAVEELAVVCGNDQLRRPAGGWHAHDALRLPE
jgi:hypothetical protein